MQDDRSYSTRRQRRRPPSDHTTRPSDDLQTSIRYTLCIHPEVRDDELLHLVVVIRPFNPRNERCVVSVMRVENG